MNQWLKKLVASILVFALSFQCFSGALIALSPEEEESEVVTSSPVGNLEVDLKLTLPIKNVEESNFVVALKGEQGETKIALDQIPNTGIVMDKKLGNDTITVTVRKLDYTGSDLSLAADQKEVYYYALTFTNLKTGNYQLSLSGNGYLTYTLNDIAIQDYSKRVTLSNESGLFAAGDFNKDGIIDSKDTDLLIANIGSKDQSHLLSYDLNRDGSIDLIDLTYLATSLNGTVQKPKIVNTSVIVDTTETKLTGDIASGTVADLFSNDKTAVVALGSEDGEVISKEKPVQLELVFDQTIKTEEIRLNPNQNSVANAPSEVEVTVEDENGKKSVFTKKLVTTEEVHFFTDKADTNTIIIDLNGQIAVKKVTIKVIKTANNTNLAEIGQVEFLNNVYEEVPAPKLDIPTSVVATPGSEEAEITWDYTSNTTGYEVRVEQKDANNVYSTQVFQTSYNHYTVKELDNYTTYTVSVRSINGDWKSPYSNGVTVTPIPKRLPPAVESIHITGKYAGLQISWKKMKDTTSFNLFYREKGTNEYQVIRDLTTTSYQLYGLKEDTTYEVYLTGNNHLGEGSKSVLSTGKTLTLTAPKTPNYKLINTPNGTEVTSHITDVTYTSTDLNLFPNGFHKFNIVDNNYASFWQATSNGWYNAGPTITFDQAYEMDHLIFIPRMDGDFGSMLAYYSITVEDENGNKKNIVDSSRVFKSLGNGAYQVSFPKANVKKLTFQLTRAYAAPIAFSELKFYYYDSLADDINDLFKDDLHLTLKDGVTLDKVNQLQGRLDTKDLVSEEYHPDRTSLNTELQTARDILNAKTITNVITVDQTISNARNSHLGFAMALNDYQPLGISAKAGEELIIYVGTKGNVLPKLVVTQFYGESSSWTRTIDLVKGKNVITVPSLTNMDVEKGGSIYLRYPNEKESGSQVQVRVIGGTQIPVLDVHNITDTNTYKTAIETYINTLKTYVNELPSIYENQKTTDEDGKPLDNVYGYDQATSVRNVTEIVTKNGMFSVSATQALKGITTGLNTSESEITRLSNSLKAFEEMMDLFYQQKGLYQNPDTDQDGTISAEEAKHKMPGSRIDIRQMRMFDGAFMYAGGWHIGIGSGSVLGLMQGRPNTNESGNVTTSGYFGWGISHEIGHQIDEGDMIFGETTNNIFSLFAQTNDDKAKSRLELENKYNAIYSKVTSGTTGLSSDVFVSLGMFWQLHLAYDNQKTLDDKDSFYAKLNRLYRTTTLKADKNNLLIMLASDVAEKDLTEFFKRWGLEASATTLAYLKSKGYEKETKAIYYLNDEARRDRLNGGKAMASDTKVDATIEQLKDNNGNLLKTLVLNFQVNQDNDRILGYEILRNGVSVAFVTGNTYTDALGAINNRAFTYQVIAYDKQLNKTSAVTLDPIKVTYDGSVDKKGFTISSNLKNEEDVNTESDGPIMNGTVNRLLDQSYQTFFQGNVRIKSTDKTDPYLLIDLNRNMAVSGIKYTAAVEDLALLTGTIQKYEIYVSSDNVNWTLVKTGSMNLSPASPSKTIYFDKAGTVGGDQLWTYQTSYIKIVAKGAQKISGAEVDIIAPPGDNIELNKDSIGILKEDYRYGTGENDIIEKGSIIFQGDYRGNPAYNVVLLLDEEENVANGTQLLYASLPEQGSVEEIASGKWIYYMTKEDYTKLKGKIKANLYRVDDALNLTGQRLVSDTLYTTLPSLDSLKEVIIEKGADQ